jgi:hypothetical protein
MAPTLSLYLGLQKITFRSEAAVRRQLSQGKQSISQFEVRYSYRLNVHKQIHKRLATSKELQTTYKGDEQALSVFGLTQIAKVRAYWKVVLSLSFPRARGMEAVTHQSGKESNPDMLQNGGESDVEEVIRNGVELAEI